MTATKKQSTAIHMIRQGDVGMKMVPAVPAGAKPVQIKDRIVLAEGEVTGHLHAVSTMFAQMFQTAEGQRFIEVKEGGELVHAEAGFQQRYENAGSDEEKLALVEERKPDHNPIQLKAGVYEVLQQREWSDEDARVVED